MPGRPFAIPRWSAGPRLRLSTAPIQVSTRKREPTILDRMFDRPETDDLDAVSCARALEAVVLEQRRVGARRFALVAQWADTPPPRPGGPARAVQPGSVGTPDVDEFTATELGMLLGTST